MHVVSVGHVTTDELADAVHPGGAALYAGLAAAALGAEVTLLTRAGPDFVGRHLFEKLQRVHVLPSSRTTAFDERYLDEQRLVRLLGEAEPVDMPVPVADVVLLCPVAREVPDAALAVRPTRLLAAGLQGWLRGFASDGVSTPRPLAGVGRFSGCHLVSCSEEDLRGLGPETVAALRATVSVVAVTDGAAGARLYSGARGWHVAALSVEAVDPTGAGDAFLATLALRLALGRPLLEAAQWAACAGAVAVTGLGPTSLAGLAALPESLKRYAREARAPVPLRTVE
jgi:bifunctional ADP-heptose synthase (sugar kinase/adenylyltransferase)